MTTEVNAIDVLLQAASTRLLPAILSSNLSVAWTNVVSRPTSLATLNAADGATLVTAVTNAATANTAITNIASDSILSAVEKSALRKEWDAIASERSILEAQATSVGVTTEKTTYSNAWQSLATYLNSGTTWTSGVPSWIADANLASNTTITAGVFRSTFKTYYDARVALIKRVTDVAATLANWSDIVSKPTDAEIMNDQQQTHANLVPGLRKWIHGGANWVYTGSIEGVDRTSLIIPSGSNDQASYIVISSTANQTLFVNQTYTISFKAWCYSSAGRTLTVDLYPDTLPENLVVLTNTPTQYSFQWVTASADIVNSSLRFFANSVAAQVEITDIQLEIGSVRTLWKPNILDNIGINNQITQVNYATYMAAQSISAMAFSMNSSGLSTTGTLSTTLAFDSNGENVLAVISGTFSSNGYATTGYCSCDIDFDIIGVGTYLRDIACKAPNIEGGPGVEMTWARTVYIASPGAGSKTYRLQVDFDKHGDGVGGVINNVAIQLIGLKR